MRLQTATKLRTVAKLRTAAYIWITAHKNIRKITVVHLVHENHVHTEILRSVTVQTSQIKIQLSKCCTWLGIEENAVDVARIVGNKGFIRFGFGFRLIVVDMLIRSYQTNPTISCKMASFSASVTCLTVLSRVLTFLSLAILRALV